MSHPATSEGGRGQTRHSDGCVVAAANSKCPLWSCSDLEDGLQCLVPNEKPCLCPGTKKSHKYRHQPSRTRLRTGFSDTVVTKQNCHSKHYVTLSGVTLSGKHCIVPHLRAPIPNSVTIRDRGKCTRSLASSFSILLLPLAPRDAFHVGPNFSHSAFLDPCFVAFCSFPRRFPLLPCRPAGRLLQILL